MLTLFRYCLFTALLLVLIAPSGHAQTEDQQATEADKITEAPEVTQAVTQLDHLGLAVLDLEASADFFINALGFQLRGGDPDYPAKFLFNGHLFLTLWQVTDADSAVKFDRKNNVGLHHLALSVSSFEALDKLYEVVAEWEGVVVEFPPELAYGGPAKHMMIREPSGNRLELVHRP